MDGFEEQLVSSEERRRRVGGGVVGGEVRLVGVRKSWKQFNPR